MKQFTFRTIIQKDGKGYHGFVPSLPGCHTNGATITEVRENIKEAVAGWIEANQELGWEIPSEEGIETIETITLKPSKDDNFVYA